MLSQPPRGPHLFPPSSDCEKIQRRIPFMRLRFNKTHSQHQLAVKLRVEPAENSGLLSWEHRRLLIHAAKTALAAALCWWLPEWNRTADAAVEVALEAEAGDHRRTAGSAWLRAAVNRHFGKFVWLLDRDLHAEATLRSVQELLQAHRCLETGAERIEVPFAGAKLVANLRRPSGEGRPPLVVLIPGLDSTKEEFFHLEEAFLQRGMATLSIDGPGPGEVGLELPMRHDYEVGVGAV